MTNHRGIGVANSSGRLSRLECEWGIYGMCGLWGMWGIRAMFTNKHTARRLNCQEVFRRAKKKPS